MPIYEYQCQACGHELEVIQKVSDTPLTQCPACGKAKLKKHVSASAFHLKGEGWYVTDFREKQSKATQTNDEKNKEKDEDKDISTVESESAHKATESETKDADKQTSSKDDKKTSSSKQTKSES